MGGAETFSSDEVLVVPSTGARREVEGVEEVDFDVRTSEAKHPKGCPGQIHDVIWVDLRCSNMKERTFHGSEALP